MSRWVHVTVYAPPGVVVKTDDDSFSESRTASLDPGEIVAPPSPDDPIVLRLFELREAGTEDARRRARRAARSGGQRIVVRVPYTPIVTRSAIDNVRALAAAAGVDSAVLIVYARSRR